MHDTPLPSPWMAKAHRLIAALCTQAKQEALARANTRRRRKLRLEDAVPYRVPDIVQRLVVCLGQQDEAGATAIFLKWHAQCPGNHDPE